MSVLFEAPALSPSHRYLRALLLRLRRFVNRSVADMLENAVKEIGLHRSYVGIRIAPFR